MVTIKELQQLDIFHGLSDDVLEDIASFSTVREFADGEVILSEHEDGGLAIRDLYLTMDGDVLIQKHFTDVSTLKQIDIQAIDRSVVGEIGWLLGSKPSAEVTSNGDTRMLIVDGVKLFSLCDGNHQVGYNVLYRLAAILAMRLVNQTNKSA
ncbi:MAG: hypothetical protein HQL69_02240 [Magnetococcales bacterium]|nr:hypothetical protein [Magnetococcales bacterium]